MEVDLEKLARSRVQARMAFIVHALMYLAANTGLAVIWFVTGRGYPWFLWSVVGWGIGLLSHAVTLAIGPGSASERRAIERELHRLRGRTFPAAAAYRSMK